MQINQVMTTSLLLNIGGVIIVPFVGWRAARWALPVEETTKPSKPLRIARGIALLISFASILLLAFLLGNLLFEVGETLEDVLGKLDLSVSL